MPKMQYCHYCGEELGAYAPTYNEPQSCGRRECERELRAMVREERELERDEREAREL